MTTLTQTKRTSRPAVFVRKDARTKCYAIVYGRSDAAGRRAHDPHGEPALNPHRTHIVGFEPAAHEAELAYFLREANFSPRRERDLLAHFELLKRTAKRTLQGQG